MSTREQPRQRPRPGLYAILDLPHPSGLPVEAIATALLGGSGAERQGAAVVQLRAKRAASHTRLELLHRLAPVCRRADALLVINDDHAAALEFAARDTTGVGFGLHLGHEDLHALARSRRQPAAALLHELRARLTPTAPHVSPRGWQRDHSEPAERGPNATRGHATRSDGDATTNAPSRPPPDEPSPRPAPVLGLSTHTLEQARQANALSLDYIGFGPIFATRSKRAPDPCVGLDGLARACAISQHPVVAIGGLDGVRARAALRAGATFVAMISALAGDTQADVRARTLAALAALDET